MGSIGLRPMNRLHCQRWIVFDDAQECDSGARRAAAGWLDLPAFCVL
jgi:hypothetical protein